MPEKVPASEESGEKPSKPDRKPSKPDDQPSEDPVDKPSQPDSSTSMRALAGNGTHAVNAASVNTTSVDTADHTPAERYAVMMLIAGTAAAVMLLMRKRIQR